MLKKRRADIVERINHVCAQELGSAKHSSAKAIDEKIAALNEVDQVRHI